MTEERKEMNDSRSFEEQVSVRFDGFHGRFDRMEALLGNVEIKIDNLEKLQDEERLAWEHFLEAINDVNQRMSHRQSR